MTLAIVGALALVVGIAIAPTMKGSAEATGASGYRTESTNGVVVNVELTAKEVAQRVAPGVRYHVWTFNGTAPGPVIRVHTGDTIHFTLKNDSSIGMQHSIDFHAAMTPWADLPEDGSSTLTGNYQPVNPGETKTFDWVAMYPGVFMYHCGVPPVLQHISNGMYGAIVVEPPDLPPEREFVVVSSELYPGDQPIHGVYEGDLDKMNAVDPTYVVFDGGVDRYKTAPLEVAPNEPFRIWVMNAGPTLSNAFHVIGTMFNETHDTGNPANTAYGLQTYNIPPGSGAMFELQIPDPGLYPFVTHAFAYTALGAVGLIKVDPNAPPPPSSYPTFADPFTAGVDPVKGASGTPTVTGVTPSVADLPSETSSPSVSPAAADGRTCSRSGTKLMLVAKGSVFDTDCLGAPADEAITITFENRDASIPHNVSIADGSDAVFTGEVINGPEGIVYQVDALPAGSYVFRCDIHPTTMIGTLVVE